MLKNWILVVLFDGLSILLGVGRYFVLPSLFMLTNHRYQAKAKEEGKNGDELVISKFPSLQLILVLTEHWVKSDIQVGDFVFHFASGKKSFSRDTRMVRDTELPSPSARFQMASRSAFVDRTGGSCTGYFCILFMSELYHN